MQSSPRSSISYVQPPFLHTHIKRSTQQPSTYHIHPHLTATAQYPLSTNSTGGGMFASPGDCSDPTRTHPQDDGSFCPSQCAARDKYLQPTRTAPGCQG